jgi:hypothetical protein
MGRLFQRRQFLEAVAVGGCGFTLAAAGCGGKDSSPPSDPEITTTKLIFEETNAFYRKLKAARNKYNVVTLTFSGPDRIGSESRLLKEHLLKVANWEEVYQQINKLGETAEGIATLKTVFDEEVLQLKPAGMACETPTGEVVEPTTLVMFVLITFIIAGTGVALAGGEAGLNVKPPEGSNPPGIDIWFKGPSK